MIVCGNSQVNLDVRGFGTQELYNSNTCSSQEHNSIWLQVSLVTDGTLGFTLRPNSTSIHEDYDFFIFGPNVSCDNLGQAIRCSTTNPASAGLNDNTTGMNASSNDTSEGPGPDGDSFVRWLDVKAGDTYYMVIDRPIGNSGFTLEWTGSAEFSAPPVNQANPLQPLDLEKCDTDVPFEDGFTSFNLEDNTPRIRGAQNDVTISYHRSESDANIGNDKISSPYINRSNPEKIFVRITNDITGCFEVADFSLLVNLGPNFAPPTPLEVCDSAEDGDPSNGRAVFDLKSKNTEILQGQDPAFINISYYKTKALAEDGTIALPNNYYNETRDRQQVFVRIEDAYNRNCRSISTLELIVNPLPDAFDTTLVQCDEDGMEDGLTIFNLFESKDLMSGGSPDRNIQYYKSIKEAENNANEIDGAAFPNTKNPQILYGKVTNSITGCYRIAKLTLEVSTTSAKNTQLNVCDDDGSEDGFYSFTLSDADAAVLRDLPNGLELFYYETYENALLENNPLPNKFTNTIRDSQTIYARVENSNACFGVSEVELNVYHLPNIELESDYFYCLNHFPEMVLLHGGIIDDAPDTYTYAWSTGENSSEIAVNTVGIYVVRVANKNGCFKERTICVLPSNIASINNIDITDGLENNVVTVSVTGEGDYEFLLDNPIGSYQPSPSFDNVSPGFHTVFVRDRNGCGISEKLISVVGFPKFFTPNNDGYNDRWQVYGINGQFQPKTMIYIFDRMGKLLTKLSPVGDGWDGTLNGKRLPADDYWFSVTLQDGRIFKGHFTLKY